MKVLSLLTVLTTLGSAVQVLPEAVQIPLQDDIDPIFNTSAVYGILARNGYRCPAANGRGSMEYTRDDVLRAAAGTLKHSNDRVNNYPHVFRNRDGLVLSRGCKADTWIEFPILHLAHYEGWRQDADRAIFSHDGMVPGDLRFCGVVHQARRNQFALCVGY